MSYQFLFRINKQAFTLVELLVVISIISLLSSVVFGSLQSARNRAQIAAGLQFENQIHKKLYECLVVQYDFEDNFNDSSGNDYDLTPVNSPQFINSINDQRGVSFISSYLYNDDFNDILGDSDFSVSYWVKPSGDMTGRGNWGIGPGGRTGETFENFSRGANEIMVESWGAPTFSSGKLYSIDEWQHVFITE